MNEITVLWAETRMGELLPPPKFRRGNLGQIIAEPTLPSGITKKQSFYAQKLAKEQLDQLMREKYGQPKPGFRTDIKPLSDSDKGWSQAKTAETLNISEGLVSEDIDLAEKYEKNYGALRECQRVSKAYELSSRLDTLGFKHHQIAAAEDDRLKWLAKDYMGKPGQPKKELEVTYNTFSWLALERKTGEVRHGRSDL